MKIKEIPKNWIKIKPGIWYEPFKAFEKRLNSSYVLKRFVYEKVCPQCNGKAFLYQNKRRFCTRKCANKFNRKIGWKYKKRRNLSYERKVINGKFMLVHRLVMENHIGRKLRKNEIVHHINENKRDNRIENLEIMTQSEHISHHRPFNGITHEM